MPVLVEDDQGYIWVGVQSGVALLRFHPREMDKLAERPSAQLAYALYDESDGLQPGTQTWRTGVGGVRDSSGRLWVVNGPSMTIIDPRRLRDSRPPVAAAPRRDHRQRRAPSTVRAGGVAEPRHTADRIRGAQPVGRLQAAVPPSARRRRHGLGLRRRGTAGPLHQSSCGRLPVPGQHDHRRPLDRAGGVGLHGRAAVLSELVVPLDRPAVAIVCGSAIGIWLRVRAFKARYALVVAERTRMSREIHDTLLQSLAALGPELEALAVRAGPADGRWPRSCDAYAARSSLGARGPRLDPRAATAGDGHARGWPTRWTSSPTPSRRDTACGPRSW